MQANSPSIHPCLDQLGLGVRVTQEDCTELHQLQEDEDDTGDHPHVEAGDVGHSGD